SRSTNERNPRRITPPGVRRRGALPLALAPVSGRDARSRIGRSASEALVLEPVDAAALAIQQAVQAHPLASGHAAVRLGAPLGALDPRFAAPEPPGLAAGELSAPNPLLDPAVLPRFTSIDARRSDARVR